MFFTTSESILLIFNYEKFQIYIEVEKLLQWTFTYPFTYPESTIIKTLLQQLSRLCFLLHVPLSPFISFICSLKQMAAIISFHFHIVSYATRKKKWASILCHLNA